MMNQSVLTDRELLSYGTLGHVEGLAPDVAARFCKIIEEREEQIDPVDELDALLQGDDELTVEDARKAKIELERRIASMLTAFAKRTGATFGSIYIKRVDTFGGDRSVAGVEIEAQI